MEKILNIQFSGLDTGNSADQREFFTHYCNFFKEMTYDTVSYEVCITEILPDNGAILGGKPGPIQNRDDYNKYPWDELPDLYWKLAKPKFDTLIHCLPSGMKVLGGVGNGVFEISEDLVGFEYLAYMMMSDPELYAELHQRIGDLMITIWKRFLVEYSDQFVACRFGDDLGFKTSTLISPELIRQNIIPQYKRVIELIKQAGIPFLWHSCGNIFEIMDDVIELGIDAKHSNEDAIAPFEKWIKLYSDRIGLLGGIDLDLLCLKKPDEVYETVLESGMRFSKAANGYALGSGNSIPDYVPVEGYLAMVKAVQKLTETEIT
jgi:uroporphyrinogen decarboxylase